MPYREEITIQRRPFSESRVGRLMATLRSFTLGPFNPKDRTIARYFGDGPTASGIHVDESTALNYAAVWAAVSIISGDFGSLPLHTYKRLKGGGKERFPEHHLYNILHNAPNSEMSAMVFFETLQAHLLLYGNAYAEIERDGAGRVVALWPLLPGQVEPYREANGQLRYRISSAPGSPDVILDAYDVLHVPGLGFNGITGYSVVRHARESLGLLAASERFGAQFFGNGASFAGILTHPGKLSDLSEESVRRGINSRHQGVDKAHRFLILQEGMTYQKLGVDPGDAQFLESRKFQITEVCRWYNVPVHKLREMDNSSVRANIEQEALDYYTGTLRPWLRRWEQEIARKLICAAEQKTVFCEFLLDGVLRGDAKTRAESLAVQFQNGAICADEWREIENRNPLPDGQGKVFYRPSSMTPVETPVVKDESVAGDRAAFGEAFARALMANRTLALTALQKIVEYEADAARRRQKSPQQLRAWAETFYPDFEDRFCSQITPFVEAHLALTGSGDDAATLTQSMAKAYVERSLRDLRAIADGSASSEEFQAQVGRLVTRWEGRAVQFADELASAAIARSKHGWTSLDSRIAQQARVKRELAAQSPALTRRQKLLEGLTQTPVSRRQQLIDGLRIQ